MDVRSAILAAADHLQANSSLFDFLSSAVPPDCGTPGCAIGWINYFGGTRSKHTYYGILRPQRNGLPLIGPMEALGVESDKFYDRMDALNPRWRADAERCAATLRKYADRWHPAPKKERKGIPADILDIFNVEDFHRDRTEVVRSLVRNDSLVSFSGVER